MTDAASVPHLRNEAKGLHHGTPPCEYDRLVFPLIVGVAM